MIIVTADPYVLEKHFITDIQELLEIIKSPAVSNRRKMEIMIAIEKMSDRAINYYDRLIQKEENQQ